MTSQVKETVNEVKTRVRRVSFSSVLPTESTPTGKVIANIVGSSTPIEYNKDLTGIDSFIATAFLAGIRDRLSTAVSGLKDVMEISTKLVEEIANLDNGIFSANIGTSTKAKQVPDILRAWASLYKEDIDDEEVFAKYSAAWERRSEEEQKAIRTNEAVSAAIYKLQAERKEAKVGSDVELPAL